MVAGMTAGETRRRVVDAAEDLFFTRGIAGTGVDQVAAHAGVAIATLYKHAGSKDNLLREVLDRRLALWLEHWDAAIAAASTPVDRLLSVFDAFESFRATARPTQWCVFLATSSELSPAAAPDAVRALVDQDTALIARRLHQFAAELDVAEPEALAAGVLLIYNGLLASVLRAAPSDPVGTARSLVRTLVEASASARA